MAWIVPAGIKNRSSYADAHILTQLVMNRRNLCLTGSNGHGRICVHLLDLSVDTLHHGFIGTVLLFENLDKLFGTDVISAFILVLHCTNTENSVSSLTTSSKSVISLRPLTCHIPVIPGLIAIRAL